MGRSWTWSRVVGALLAVALCGGCTGAPDEVAGGTFDDVPSACAVLDDQALRDVAGGLPENTASRVDERADETAVRISRCGRSFAGQVPPDGLDRPRSRTVLVELRRYGEVDGPDGTRIPVVAAIDGFAVATEFLDGSYGPGESLRSLGDQALAGRPTPPGGTGVSVVFRESNLLVIITLDGTDAGTDGRAVPIEQDRGLDDAIELARSVAGQL